MIRNSATSSGGGFFCYHLPLPHKPVNEAGAVKIVDVRDFNLICGLAESGKSGFSTTYCGYLKKKQGRAFPEIRGCSFFDASGKFQDATY